MQGGLPGFSIKKCLINISNGFIDRWLSDLIWFSHSFQNYSKILVSSSRTICLPWNTICSEMIGIMLKFFLIIINYKNQMLLNELCVIWVYHYEFIVTGCSLQFKIPFYKEFPSLAPGALLCWLLGPFDKAHYSLRASLNSGTNCPRLLLNFSLSTLAILYFSKEPWFPAWEVMLRDYHLEGKGRGKKIMVNSWNALQGLESVGGTTREQWSLRPTQNTPHLKSFKLQDVWNPTRSHKTQNSAKA